LRRDIRRHKFDELIDDFFIALLRFGSQGKDSPLSSSRLKIAAGSLPILLGDDPRMWQRWIFMFGRIPGGLFDICEKILNSSFIRQHIDSSHDSLFDADHLMTQLTTRLQLSDIDKFESNVDYDKSLHVLIGNIRDEPAIILEAKAELELMRERFVHALGYYLAIGSRFMNELLTLVEETAVWAVNSFVNESIDSSQRDNSQCSLLTHEGVSGVERNKYCFFSVID
jgi:hypothetical protein